MKRIVECFVEACEHHRTLVAVEDSIGRQLTYQSLSEEVETLADRLRDVAGDIVAIQLPRSAEFVVALFGTWLANKTALILDPEWPSIRVDSCLKRFDASGLVTSDGVHFIANKGASVELSGRDAAYIILTSGTIGEPKGTIVGHEGIWNVLNAQIEAFMLSPTSRSYWMHGVAFDASISDIGTVLLSGATLVIDREICYEKLCERWEHLKITHVDLPPVLLPHIQPEVAPDSLRVIIVGGQIADLASVRKWSKQLRVVNVYGPTEATICTSFAVCDSHWSRPLIGDPIKGITYTIDSKSGELAISGGGVAWGYYGQPELSEARFSFQAGMRTFHSRDKVRRLDDGLIEFIGRLDRQFKLHGKLICPEEIESLIHAMDGVSHCVVQLHPERMHLVAWVETQLVQRDQILAHLSCALPKWMVPSELFLVPILPMSQNGKVDVEALSRSLQTTVPDGIKRNAVSFGENERKLCEIFKNALGYEITELETSFDQLGIDSMSVIQILIEAEKVGFPLSVQSFKKWPTIRQLAESIDLGLLLDEGRLTEELRKHIQPLALKTELSNPNFGTPEHILITGATGFFGSALLGMLLQQGTGIRITCLVRGGYRSRVLNALAKHGFTGLTDFECLDGDIELERFGLSADVWPRLAEQVDTVVHSAAKVNLVESFESCFSANVLGTANVLRFCSSGQPKSLHYISTLSVFVDAWPLPARCLETDTLENTQIVYGGYAQSKWASEKLVRKSCSNDSVSIYRLGLLTQNSSNGYAPENDLFSEFLSEHSFTQNSEQNLQCDYTPVDIAATQTAALILNQSLGTWHICNPIQMSYDLLKERAVSAKSVPKMSGISHLALAKGNSPFRVFKTTYTSFSVELTEMMLLAAQKS
jgi:thioester reductase-like protein